MPSFAVHCGYYDRVRVSGPVFSPFIGVRIRVMVLIVCVVTLAYVKLPMNRYTLQIGLGPHS